MYFKVLQETLEYVKVVMSDFMMIIFGGEEKGSLKNNSNSNVLKCSQIPSDLPHCALL